VEIADDAPWIEREDPLIYNAATPAAAAAYLLSQLGKTG